MPKHLRILGLVLLTSLLMLAEPHAIAQRAATVTPDVLATPVPFPTSAPVSTPTTTPGTTLRPDACEPNERREDACMISADQVSGPYTFLPAGDQDYYRLDLGPERGLTTLISVRGSSGLDLLTSISRDDGTLLAAYSSPAISTTLAADIAGGIVIRVENRAPIDPAGQSYTIEVRRGLPPAPTPPPSSGGPTLTPDIAENNWSPATAAPIAVGVIYDLNLSCPVDWPGACPGGDHDYMAVPVKAGGKYLICTFDLGSGVDTTLDLFWGSPDSPLAWSDDYGTGALSVIRWVAPTNGTAIVRVGPRNGGTEPIVVDEQRGFYRFAVAQAGTPLARELEQRIAEQANLPTATPSPTAGEAGRGGSAGPPAGGVPPAPSASRPAASVAGDAPTGEAVVVVESTTLRDAPSRDGAPIMELPQEAAVTLLGQSSGQYVRVQPRDGVIPGWVRGADLVRLAGRDATTPTAGRADADAPAGPTAPPLPGLNPTPSSPATDRAPRIEALPTLTSLVITPPARVPIALTVQVRQSSKTVIGPRDSASQSQPLALVRVQLVNAFGDLLTEAVTPPDGTVPLVRDVETGSAVYVRLPALGVQIGVQPGQTQLVITIPGGTA